MEISIIDSIKLPSVSISKICTYRACPDISLNSLKPGDILKIIHSNLFSSSVHVITCNERSHKGAYWWEVNIGSGNGLAPSDNKLLPGPFLSRFMTPYGVTMPQMSSVFIVHCRHYIKILIKSPRGDSEISRDLMIRRLNQYWIGAQITILNGPLLLTWITFKPRMDN